MKKTVAITLLFVLCFSLCACGSANKTEVTEPANTPPAEESTAITTTQTAAQEKPAIWSLQQTVDEFGDVTANSETIIVAPFKGTFSNTATASSDLNGTMVMQKRPDNIHYYAAFILYEYGDNPADYSSYEAKTLKVKIDDTISEFPLKSVSGNPGLAIGVDSFDYGGDWLLGMLYVGRDLRCIINVGTSQYSFTVESANLPQLMVENGLSIGPAEITAKEAINVYLTDDYQANRPAYDYFVNHLNDFPVMTTRDLEQEIQGNFIHMEVSPAHPTYWWGFRYEGTTWCQLVSLQSQYGTRYGEVAKTPYYRDLSLANDLMSTDGNKFFQIRKISDGIYLRVKEDDSGNYTLPDYLMVSYNGSLDGRSATAEFVKYVQDNMLSRVEEHYLYFVPVE